ncbi:MAG TPA: response regulator transcription factor [Verrucomicrobiae bacterium]
MTANPATLSANRPVRVALVEDLADVRASWQQLIDGIPNFKCVCTCASGEEALRRLPEETVDVVLMDIRLPRMSGIACTARLKPLMPRTQILILTVSADSDTVFRALEAGADGYLLKRSSPEELQSAVMDVLKGGVPMTSEIARRVIASFRRQPAKAGAETKLTPREEEILTLLSRGFVSKEIAAKLGVSYETVRDHLRHIYEKLHVHSRGEAVARFQETRETGES